MTFIDVIVFLAGASAAFRDAQIASVHVFTVLSAAIFAIRARDARFDVTTLLKVVVLAGGVALLAASVIGGDLVVHSQLALQLLLLCASGIAFALVTDARSVKLAFGGFAAAVTVSSLLVILQSLRIVPSQLFTDSSGLSRPTGLVGEPDWAGFYAACALVLLCRWPGRPASKWIVLGALLNLTALGLCLARASWIALVASFALPILAIATTRLRGTLHVRMLIVLVAITGLVLLIPPVRDSIFARAATLFNAQARDLNAVYRQQQLDALRGLGASAPWHGHGLSASSRVTSIGEVTIGEVDGENAVSTNWLLALIAETGVLCVPFLVVLVGVLVAAFGSVAAQLLVLALVNSLFSNVFYSPIMWFLVALVVTGDGHDVKLTARTPLDGEV